MAVVEWISAVGECAIAGVIYLEFEGHRFDRFFDMAFDDEHWKARIKIYEEFCGSKVNKSPERFLVLLNEDAGLREKCDREIALFNRIGKSLPWVWPLRGRVLRWFPHSVIFLWEILTPYVKERRAATGEYWADAFETFTRASLKHVIKKIEGDLTLRDPDRSRKNDFPIPHSRLAELLTELD